ncbi:hypothetical protein [Geothrix fuzhouensis]|uniref:GspE/PulE/PilB domain-containing protein n=1 Tax=Geothrix fuzhouensis TaxID=2966451 RepID=UPI0021494686|nr:hypothetical protein [Geothrix fuzhouensis]
MQQPIKRLGEMLVEAGLITPAQLQSAITHQKIARGRLGSNLVALGYITEEILMDFLSHQTGVPQVDVRDLAVPPEVLKLVPYRLADQFTVLPISVKEPKSLVLAMSDPSDLNAVDSARFASGLHIQPVVASHSALRKAIGDLYRNLEVPAPGAPVRVDVGADQAEGEALPVTFSLDPLPLPTSGSAAEAAFPPDPFFGSHGAPVQEPANLDPFRFFEPVEAARPAAPSELIHGKTLRESIPPLDTYQTRALVLGMIRLFQRRGILGDDELQRLLANLVESGEIKNGGKDT